MIARNCNFCQEEYEAEPRYLNRGQGLFCSRKCASKFNGDRKKVFHEPNVSCAFCSTRFYVSPAKQKGSKSGLFFCSRSHKDEAQKIGGIEAIMPPHYGTAKIPEYRKKAFRELPNECRVCKYNKYVEVLEVNHIDCNRANNDISNLEILCPTHHTEYHFETGTGSWARREIS